MNHRSFYLLFAVVVCVGFARQAWPADASPPTEIRYIPLRDLWRAEGYNSPGVFLPLVDLLKLVRAADSATSASASAGAVSCTGIHLSGSLRSEAGEKDLPTGLVLEGSVAFSASSDEWSATLIDDGSVPWASQALETGDDEETSSDISTQARAFLAHVGKATYLFARGPLRASLKVSSLVPVAFGGAPGLLQLGGFRAPCIIELDLPKAIALDSSNVPIETRRDEEGSHLIIWPAQRGAPEVYLRQSTSILAPSALRITDSMHVAAEAGALHIADHLHLEDRFTSGTSIELALPSGVRVLRTDTRDLCSIELTDGHLRLQVLRDVGSIDCTIWFAADMQNGRAVIGSWGTPAAATHSVLTLASSESLTPVLAQVPMDLIYADSEDVGVRRYEISGPRPPVEIALVSTTASIPPSVASHLDIERGEARVNYAVDLHEIRSNEFIFTIPKGWIVTDFSAMQRDSKLVPASFQPQREGEWRVSWAPDGPWPARINFSLHRSGGWGRADTTEELGLPFVVFEGERPAIFEMSVAWPTEFEVEASAMIGLEIVPIGEASGTALVTRALPPTMAVRATSVRPSGVVTIRGRASDIRATTVTTLNVEADRTTIRALILYSVQFASTNTLRFILPSGTGSAVRIDGEGIRETTMRPVAEGEEWTILTQQGVLGNYPVQLEWPLRSLTDGSLLAPRILLPDVSSQRGFVLVEGSESLRLTLKPLNLAEADLAELPPLPWSRQARVISVYRFASSEFELRVTPEKFQTERGIGSIAREAKLSTTLSPDGTRLTRARYSIPPTAEGQFFEIRPPKSAEVWAALVDGEGSKPARREDQNGESILMVPLPAVRGRTGDILVEVFYRESAKPLEQTTNLVIQGPRLTMPVNRTSWDLNLPHGYEYLAYGGSLGNWATVRQPFITFLRTAYYPRQIILQDWSIRRIVFLTFILAGGWFAFRKIRFASRRVHVRIVELLIVATVLSLLFAISVPNFLEAQVRSKVSRVKADQRSLATAIESYYVDNGFYPANIGVLWQGSVKYTASGFPDPYQQNEEYGSYGSGESSTYRYLAGEAAFDKALRTGLVQWDPTMPRPADVWVTWSDGPDGHDDGGEILYDPTNGSTSAGDVVRLGGGIRPISSTRITSASDTYRTESRRIDLDNLGYLDGGVGNAGQESAASKDLAQEHLTEVSQLVERKAELEKQKTDGQDTTVSDEIATLNRRLAEMDKKLGGVVGGVAAMKEERISSANSRRKIAELNRDANNLAKGGRTDEALGKVREILALDPENEVAKSRERTFQSMLSGDSNEGELATQDASAPEPVAAMPPASPQLEGIDAVRTSEQAGADTPEASIPPPDGIRGAPGGAEDGDARTQEFFDDFEDSPDLLFAKATMVSRHAGLLSLDIEFPEGGVRRTFEGLTGEARVEVRLMSQRSFLRLAFIVWIGVFGFLGWFWFKRRTHYRGALFIVISFAILTPVIVQTSYVALFNSAFQGALFSLILPIFSRVRRRVDLPPASIVVFLIIIAAIGAAPASARAESVPRTSPPALPSAPVRILVPYESESPPNPAAMTDAGTTSPLAFVSRSDFARLWNSAHPTQERLPDPGAAIESINLTGALSPETSTIRGTIAIRANNPNDHPTTVSLALSQLRIENAPPSPAKQRNPFFKPADSLAPIEGTSLIQEGGASYLLLAPHWAGELQGSFTLPCEMQGEAGGFHLEFPEVAAGLWTILIPYAASISPASARIVSERTAEGTVLKGTVGVGKLAVLWNSAHGTAGVSGQDSDRVAWRGVIENRFAWDSLESADWSATLKLTSESGTGFLPSEITLAVPSELRITGVSGAALQSVEISAGMMTLRLSANSEAQLSLNGMLLPSSEGWRVSGVHPSTPKEFTSSVVLEISDNLEIVSTEANSLERQPTGVVPEGYLLHLYEAMRSDWNIQLSLRQRKPIFAADITELFLPGQGYLRRGARIAISPQGKGLGELLLTLPENARVSSLDVTQPAYWVQSGSNVFVTFQPAIIENTQIFFRASTEQSSESPELVVHPVGVLGARELHRRSIIALPSDLRLEEVDLGGAQSATSDQDAELFNYLTSNLPLAVQAPATHAYEQGSGEPLHFALRRVEDARPLVGVFNRVMMSEGIQTLESVVIAKPRVGRLRTIDLTLLLPNSDPTVAARLVTSGPVRHTRVEPAGDLALRISVELDTPAADSTMIKFSLEEPTNLERGVSTRVGLIVPAETDGARAFLLLHRAFEGELVPAEPAGSRSIDHAEVPWPEGNFPLFPSDLIYELDTSAEISPSFNVRRHVRQEALRAVVDSLRDRVIITRDGIERHELEIILQNESEQFLKVALPYERSSVKIYETLVAGHAVRTAFVTEGNAEVLAIPLIRTGMLDPELKVRVAFTVDSGENMSGSGTREQRLPSVLGGVPVAQSSLILMLPSDFVYDDFDGSLEQIDLVDLELDEAERMARTAEKITQTALYSRGEVQGAWLNSLNSYQFQTTTELESAEINFNAQNRMEAQSLQMDGAKPAQAQVVFRKKSGERSRQLQRAKESYSKAMNNVADLNSLAQTQRTNTFQPDSMSQMPREARAAVSTVPAQLPTLTPQPTVMPMEFPHVGEIFVFRQLQGTGAIHFDFSSRASSGRRSDLLAGLFAVLIIIMTGSLSRIWVWTRRRIAIAIFMAATAGLLAGVLIDIAIPLIVIAIIVFMTSKNRAADDDLNYTG